MTNNTPKQYAKKLFVIFLLVDVAIIFIDTLYNSINYVEIMENSCPFFTTFLLVILLVPALLTLTYIAFFGARKILQNPSVGNFSFYGPILPLSLLSVIASMAMGFILVSAPNFDKVPYVFKSIMACSGIFLFFGGWLLFPIFFVVLYAIGLIEAYLIKQRLLREMRRDSQSNKINGI